MKKILSVLMIAFAMTAMVACGEKDNTNLSDTTGGGNNPSGGTSQSDTTIMNYTLMRSLLDIDWDVACNRVLAMGFQEIESDEGENVRVFIKGSLMSDYYACYLRCDYPEVDNLVGSVVMHEHHMNSSNQATCLENEIRFIHDEQRVLSDMTRNLDCGGTIVWGDLSASGQLNTDNNYYPGASALVNFEAFLRAMTEHTTVEANWGDNYIYNNSLYVATCSAFCSSQAIVSVMENILTLEKEDNLDK